MEDKPKEILKLEQALGIDHVDYYKWDGEKVTELTILNKKLENVAPLIEFKNLRVLDLGGNNISDISALNKLSNLSILNLGVNNVIDATPLNSLSSLRTLDLSANRNLDFSTLKNLQFLEKLILNEIESINFSDLKNLRSIKELSLERCKIVNISYIKKFDGLVSLNLRQNNISDLDPLKALLFLKLLDLSVNKISDISSFSFLKKLEELNLYGNRIKTLEPLSQLVNLTYLNIKGNKIVDLSPLSNLKELKRLDLDSNRIRDLKPLSDLRKIKILGLSRNEIENIRPLTKHKELNVLDLSVNNINDVSPLSNLNKLITLELYDNKISDISSLKNFYSLRYLDLSYNNIVDFSHLKYLIQEGKQLLLTNDSPNDRILIKNNPIDDTLTLAIEKGNEAILEYFEKYEIERKKGSRPINEAKLIIIGEPESGKTTLMNYLQGKPFTVPSTTQGFTIERWIVKGNQTNYRINIWDFGGQDIQSTVHQFFLTQDTLYLMVLNARKDELPDKYIEQIKSYAPDSPIIIVVNRIEENPSYEMGVKRLQETHKDKDGNSLIKGVFKVSLLKGHKELNPSYFPILENMRQAIQKELLEMPHIHRPVPVTYLAVKEYLESAFFADKPYISHDTYEAICREKGLDAQSDNDLLGYLNNLGTVRYFDDLSLRNLQILNPEWLSDGVYRILVSERTKQLRGIITEKDFETILQKTEEHQFEYPKHHYNYLIQMIRKFDMGYQDEQTGRIFIPRAFGLDYVQNFNASQYKKEAIHFFFRYESFIPSTIMPAFISRMFGLVKDQLYSQDGVVLEQNGQFALVEQTTIKNRIDLWVSGDKSRGEYFEFFLEIRKVFREFHGKRPGLVVDEMIGLGNNSDVSVKYKQLIANKINGVNDYIGEDGKKYNIDELLGRFESKNNTVQYITEQNNYHIGGDMYAGQIFLIKQHTNELLELLKQNKDNFSVDKQAEIEKMISELESVQNTPQDKSSSKTFWQQLNETRKNIAKISSEEAVKWFTKEALSGKFNETIINAANKVMSGLQNPMLRDFVDNGSNIM